MTTGVTLYLVSACGTAEEFVAAFRRYADRTGLFIPSAAPLPAGRRGRLALTLKDGGVMIEGEAEILQSSAKPTVLHGRPGMTIKFVEPDDLSKTVITELEKARLAMKPAPPTVPPRPSSVAAEPRPVVPAIGGRIDAANALAECVVIGDAAHLVDTANAPKSVTDAGSGKAKFIVPSIPGVGSPRPNTPSTPPPLSGVPSAVGASPSGSTPRPKTPSIPPDPASKPLPAPTKAIAPKMTSIGFPVLDKVPAGATPAKPSVPGVTPQPPAANPLLDTKLGTPAPPNRTKEIASPENPLLQTQLGTPGSSRGPVSNATTMGMPSIDKQPAARAVSVNEEATTIGEGPPKPPAPAEPPPPTASAAPVTKSPTPPAGTPPTPGTLPGANQRATSIGFPAVRTPFETQALGTVRPPGSPAPPVVPGETQVKPGGSPGPRGKSATRPPLTPRHPTPVAPVPIVRSPAKAAPSVDAIVENAIVEEEKTDLSEVPQPPAPAAAFATADTVDAAVDPLGTTQLQPQRSGGMRASEIMAAIPSGDWTMSPDASGPTAVGGAPQQPEAPVTVAPTSAPKGPPTGNWSISLDPETGWSEPVKVEKAVEAPKPAPKQRRHATSGNPDITVSSSEKGFTAVEWEEKPTGIGEAKIEIDSTLMEPLKPMPDLDDEGDPLSAPPAAGDGNTAPARPIKYITPPAGMPAASDGPFAAPAGPSPFAPGAGPYPTPPSGVQAAGYVAPPSTLQSAPPPMTSPVAVAGYPSAAMPAANSQLFANAQPDSSAQYSYAQADFSGGAATAAAAKRRKQTIIIAVGAIAALAAGFALVLVLAGGKKKATTGNDKGSGSALVEPAGSGSAVVQPTVGSGSASAAGSAEPALGSGSAIAEEGSGGEPSGSGDGSAVAAVDVAADAGVKDEPVAETGPCKVSVTSIPSGADVYMADKKLGTTPLNTELPCGVDAKLTLRKAKFINTARSFTPKDGKGNKVVVKLAKTTFTLKVTSAPAGATITVGGRSMGVTPATIRLPAYEASAVVVSKPGYASVNKSVTPKSNNISHHVVLKKGKR